MAEITIKKIPTGLRDKYKADCALRGTNMREDLLDYMTKTTNWKEPETPKTPEEEEQEAKFSEAFRNATGLHSEYQSDIGLTR